MNKRERVGIDSIQAGYLLVAFLALNFSFFQSISFGFGVVTGMIVAYVNIFMLKMLVLRITNQSEQLEFTLGKARAMINSTILFKYMGVGFILYYLSTAGVIDLFGTLVGYTASTAYFVYTIYKTGQQGREIDGTSAFIY